MRRFLIQWPAGGKSLVSIDDTIPDGTYKFTIGGAPFKDTVKEWMGRVKDWYGSSGDIGMSADTKMSRDTFNTLVESANSFSNLIVVELEP